METATTTQLRDRLVQQMVGALSEIDARRSPDTTMLVTRVGFLVDAFQGALVAGEPARFARYVAKLAISRIGEGSFLREMLRTLDVLETTTWDQIVSETEASAAIPRLRLLVRTTSAAREQLARSYRAHTRLAEREIDELIHVVRELAPRSALRLRLSRLAKYFTIICE